MIYTTNHENNLSSEIKISPYSYNIESMPIGKYLTEEKMQKF